MNILLITDLYPVKETEKTTPKTLLNFVKEWEKQGHTVDVIKPNFILNSFLRGKPFYKTGKYGNIYNVNYWTPFLGSINKKIEGKKLGGQEGRLFNNSNIDEIQQKQQIDKNCSTTQPFNYSTDTSLPSCPPILQSSIILAHMPSSILFADKLGLPFIAGVHNSDLVVLTSPLYKVHFRKRMIKALQNAKAIACRSFVIKDKLLKLYPEFENKTFVAPSGIDKKIFNNPSTSQPFNPSTLKILTCANFKKRKNIDMVIKACKELECFELTVVGDGNIRKSLEKIDKNVIFTGRLESEEVYKKMRESDIFILPSVYETFGLVYLEAMANGCITVCTKDDGISGIIKDGENGFLTEPTIEGIKNTLLKIKNSSPETIEKIRQNAFETLKNYTSDKAAENYLQQILKFM